MHYLLAHGPLAFLLGKYVMTAAGIPFLVVYKNYPMFGSRFRVGIPASPCSSACISSYCRYQWVLFHSGRIEPSAATTAGIPISACSGSGRVGASQPMESTEVP